MKFKVGDIVTSFEDESEEKGIIVEIDENDIDEPYCVYIYRYDFAVWCKESKLTLKSPS